MYVLATGGRDGKRWTQSIRQKKKCAMLLFYNSMRKLEIIFVGGLQGPPDPEAGEQLPGADPDARAESRLSGTYICMYSNPDPELS